MIVQNPSTPFAMFSFFKRRQQKAARLTANDRIREFWDWFEEVAPIFLKAIDDGRCAELTEITSQKVDEFFPGFAWVYGPGADGCGHSFTLSGEGVEHRQLLALHWLAQAPLIKGWTFYAARQPGVVKGGVITFGQLQIDPKEIWVTPSIDEEEEKADLTIWHPLWPQLEKNQQWTIVFLFLDEALGEYGTKWWIGQIRLENDRLAESFPLEELSLFVDNLTLLRGWKKYLPGEGYSLLNIQPSKEKFPRHDLITLNTSAINLFHDHREAKGEMEDPFVGTGADYVYVSFRRDFLSAGEEVNERGNLEEALDAALKIGFKGRCLGGGFGLHRAYIDLLIFDGQKSLDAIIGILKAHNLPKGTTLNFFAKDKSGEALRF